MEGVSTIGSNYEEEDIHDIIHKPKPPIVKSPRYVSKRKLSDLHALKKKYNGHQTFGLAHYEPPESKNFLRKGKQKTILPAVKSLDKKEFKCTINCKSSPLPKCSSGKQKEAPKNHVKENVKRIATLRPKVPAPRRVETPRGTTKELGHLLQMIKIRESEEYGKIPKYLCERRKMWDEERRRQELERQALLEYNKKMGIGTMGMDENLYMIDAETRQKILDGLKENWNELSKNFLKLPVMTDTWPKIKRKMWLEKEIDQLEKDVRLVETHPYIYLERNNKRFFESQMTEELNKQKSESEQKEKEKEKDKQEPETVEAEPEENSREEQTEEIADDKKDEDKEINILNY